MGPKSGGNYAGARGPKFWAKMAKNRGHFEHTDFAQISRFRGGRGFWAGIVDMCVC